MNATVDTLQAETGDLQAKFTSLKTAIDGFMTGVSAKIDALGTQITTLKAAGVDPALLTPLAQLQTDMQSEIDAVTAASQALNPTPAAAPAPAPPSP